MSLVNSNSNIAHTSLLVWCYTISHFDLTMSSHKSTGEQNGYYPAGPQQSGRYQYQDITYPQRPVHQPAYPVQPPQSNNPYYSYAPTTAPSSLSGPGYPISTPQQYDTGHYYPQQATQYHQAYPQSSAAYQYPPNPSRLNNTGYYQSTPNIPNIPNHPPPAYGSLPSPDQNSLQQVEPVTSEQVHDAEAFVDEETLGWIPSQKHSRQQQQLRRLEVRFLIHPH